MHAGVRSEPDPSCATAAPTAKSDPPIVNATAAIELSARNRLASGSALRGVALSASGPRTWMAPRLRARRDVHVAVDPSGSRQMTLVRNGPHPSVRSTVHPSGVARGAWPRTRLTGRGVAGLSGDQLAR